MLGHNERGRVGFPGERRLPGGRGGAKISSKCPVKRQHHHAGLPTYAIKRAASCPECWGPEWRREEGGGSATGLRVVLLARSSGTKALIVCFKVSDAAALQCTARNLIQMETCQGG